MLTLEVDGKGPGETCELAEAGKVRVAATVESYVPFHKIEVIMNGRVMADANFDAGDAAGPRLSRLEVELPIAHSSWVALRVRGPRHPLVFDGLTWAHTSPVYIRVAGRGIASRQDAESFVAWIEQMLRAVAARNRFAKGEDRRQVEALFRRAQDGFRKMADAR
jgi:hypothetical protein